MPEPPKSGFRFLSHTLDSLENLPAIQDALDSIVASRLGGRPGYPPKAMFRAFCIKYLLADRGYDSQANHRRLVERGIAPTIHVRKPTAEDRLYDVLYDKRGRPVCGDGSTPMEYLRTDSDSGRHGFRCPPDGCALKVKPSGAVRYCDTAELWLDPSNNLRALGVVYRDSAEWKRLYAHRQVIERMFGSLKRSRLLDRRQYVRRDKIDLHLGLSVLTYLATMLARLDAGDPGMLRHMRITSITRSSNVVIAHPRTRH